MLRLAVGFHQDNTGDWVVELDCLHRVHVRHDPPFQERPWVLDDAGRTARIGTDFDCVRCDRFELPDDLHVARTAGPFDDATLPAGLRRFHRVGTSTWGCLRVLEGSVTIEFDAPAVMTRAMVRGDTQPIPPDVPHHVHLGDDAVVEIDFLVR